MQETLAFVDALVNQRPAPCTGEDGLVALVMAIAAGTSAAEGRWVELKELAPVLCEAVPVGEGLEYGACEAAIVDGQSGALRFDVITNPRTGLIKPVRTTAVSVFEKFASKVWVPPSRPDLKKKREIEIAREVKGNQ